MLDILHANNVEIPPTATVAQIRDLFNSLQHTTPQDIDGEMMDSNTGSEAEANPYFFDSAATVPSAPAETYMPAALAVGTDEPVASAAVSTAATISHLQNDATSAPTAVRVQNAAANKAAVTPSAAQIATSMDNENPPVEAQIMQLQRERELLLLRREVGQLRQQHPTMRSARFNLNVIEAMVAQFGGDDVCDVRKWTEDLEDAFDILQFDDQARFVILRRLLIGTAKIFTRTISAHSYENLRDALIEEFGRKYSVNEVYAQLRARRLNSSETVHRYVLDMQEIAARGKILENELIDFIISGIGDTSNNAAILFSATTVPELKSALNRYERMRSCPAVSANSRRPTPPSANPTAQLNSAAQSKQLPFLESTLPLNLLTPQSPASIVHALGTTGVPARNQKDLMAPVLDLDRRLTFIAIVQTALLLP